MMELDHVAKRSTAGMSEDVVRKTQRDIVIKGNNILKGLRYGSGIALINKINEVADLWFHTLVMLSHLDTNHAAVLAVLDQRMGLSGLTEKASRNSHNDASGEA